MLFGFWNFLQPVLIENGLEIQFCSDFYVEVIRGLKCDPYCKLFKLLGLKNHKCTSTIS